MPAFTSPDNIQYPIQSDSVVPLAGVFEALAETTQAAIKTLKETTERTSNHTLALSDAGMVIPMNSTSAATVTVPINTSVALPIGTVINVYNMSEEPVTIVGASGVTVRNSGSLDQYGEVSLRKRATNEWVVAGNLS
jgi:hypothetical protein